MANQPENWWTRPCGGREVLGIALPLVISTMSFTIMHFCDRMFLAWYSTSAMAAASMAGAMNWSVFSFPMGVAAYANTFVAQYHGAGHPERIGGVIWQAVRVGIYSTPLFLVVALLSPSIFRLFGHSEHLLWLEVSYFRVLAFASTAVVLAAALSSFYIGRGETRPVMYVNIIAAVMNVVLDVLWIFGYAGFPAMGIEGAAWATVASQWFKVVAYLYLIYRHDTSWMFQLGAGWPLDLNLIKRLFHYGGPNGLQYVIEGSSFTVVFLLIGNLGELEAAASSVALSVNMVAFVPMIGIGMAISTLVGQQIGGGNPRLAARATWTGWWIAMVYTTIFGGLYLLVPDLFVMPHALGSRDFDEIRALSIVLLRFVAAYCLFDALQIVFVSALKGAGDTAFVLVVTIVTASTFVVTGIVGARYDAWGIMAWWSLITGWILVLAAVYLARFLQGRWRSMRVIEPDFVKADDESLSPAIVASGDGC